MIHIENFFEDNEGEYLKFESFVNPPSTRPDLSAFLILNDLFPSSKDIVSAAAHDEIWLRIDCDELAAKATEEQLLNLMRCGIRYDSSVESLAMFV